ncbi:hypothetical protein XENOCAPTIV_026819, partial [Xenoophorus captivus]
NLCDVPPDCGSTHLPVFGDSVPNSDLPGVAGGDQLVTNEEESLGRHIEAEHACRRKQRRVYGLILGPKSANWDPVLLSSDVY